MKWSRPPGGQLAGSRTSAIVTLASGRSASLLPASSSSHVSIAFGSLATRAMGTRAIGIWASPTLAIGTWAMGTRAMGTRAIGTRAIGVVSGWAVPVSGAEKSTRAIGADSVESAPLVTSAPVRALDGTWSSGSELNAGTAVAWSERPTTDIVGPTAPFSIGPTSHVVAPLARRGAPCPSTRTREHSAWSAALSTMVDVVANCGTTQFVGPKLFGSEVNSYGGLAVTAAPPPGWVALSVQPATLVISVPTSVTAPAQSTGAHAGRAEEDRRVGDAHVLRPRRHVEPGTGPGVGDAVGDDREAEVERPARPDPGTLVLRRAGADRAVGDGGAADVVQEPAVAEA